MRISTASTEQLIQLESQLSHQYDLLRSQGLKLDVTRGKPSAAQLDLSDALDGALHGNYRSGSGVDTRNYTDVWGLPEARRLGAELLEVAEENVMASGNSSLMLMFFSALLQMQFGTHGPRSAWRELGEPKFLCPVPGYDRHFAVCEKLGIGMVTVPMTDTGPDMDAVEQMVADDHTIVGLWCVPRFSNPTGCVYSAETVRRIARLGKRASPNFRVFWDNAYAVHHLGDDSDRLASIWHEAEQADTLDNLWLFGSTSKITYAGAGIAWVAGSQHNLGELARLLGIATIGFDKVNQLRHCRLFPDIDTLREHMQQHADILRPKFELVQRALDENLDEEYGRWSRPRGGYFVSFDTQPGLASEVVRLAGDAGVKLTPAGATFPYGKDPENRNIRLAPSLPPLGELEPAMEIFVCCVKLATVRQKLAGIAG